MESTNHEVGESRLPVAIAQPENDALEIIRTETVLSKLPVHNLAKQGRVDIQILKTTPDGKIDLKWEVSYNERYGQARQLAYKLDTIVVDHHVELAGRPLPERIRLGSLREIADELGIAEGDTATLKKALHQNAGVYITAKIWYTGNDGSKRTLEAGFTRYTVIFTGQKFPDGSKADAVYIELHPRYREVLNNAPVRPLDLAYKKALPPAAQRFYEIVSYKIFSAIKNNHPFAKLPYSEYSTFSAQQRYFDYEHFKKQMYKIHRPHLQAGYISTVHYQQATDEAGKPDWIMCYTPGAKAHAEFAAAHRGHKIPTIEIQPGGAGERPPRKSSPRQRRFNLKPPAPETTPQNTSPVPAVPVAVVAPVVDELIVAQLVKRGIGETESRNLLAKLIPGQPVIDQLEYSDAVLRQPRSSIRNPQGFIVARLQENVPVPDHFETTAKRKLREEAEHHKREEQAKRQSLEIAYDEYQRSETDRYIAAHVPAADYAKLLTQETARLKADRWSGHWPAETLKAMADRAVKKRLADQLPIPFLTIEQFGAQEGQRRSQNAPATR